MMAGPKQAKLEVWPILAVSHEPCFLLSSKGNPLGNPHLNGAHCLLVVVYVQGEHEGAQLSTGGMWTWQSVPETWRK